MRKRLIVVFLLLAGWPLPAQQMSVSKMESRWMSMYQEGVRLLEDHRYGDAEAQFSESIDLLKSNGAENSTYHLYALLKLGEVYAESGQAAKQDDIEKAFLAIGTTLRPGSKRQTEYLYNLGLYYSDSERFDEAVKYLDQALSNELILRENPDINAKILHRKALCAYFSGNMDMAQTLARESMEKDENQTPDYIKTLAHFYFQSADWGHLDELMPLCFTWAREPVLRKFFQSGAKDRASFWSRAEGFFTKYLPYYAMVHPSEVLVSCTYDASLFCKGVLLAAENKSSELTLNSNNPQLIRQFERYRMLRGKKERTLDEEFEMQALSDVIVRFQKENKNSFREDFRINWKEVRDRLEEGDIAIEFMSVPGADGTDQYIALSVKKGQPAPVLTRLAGFDQLSGIPEDDIYRTSAMFDLVWGPLEDELNGVRRVFFSPAGLFYNTAIEYLPDEDGVLFSTARETHRLSSTKEIVLNRRASLQKGVLIGGVNYDTQVSTLAGQRLNHDFDSRERSIPLDSMNFRGAAADGGFSYLAGTMEEVEEISSLFLESGLPARLYCGDEGSETVLKNLSGTDADLLHIATHGFYYATEHPGVNVSPEKLFKDLALHFTSPDIEPIDEDKMLTRSGLILAGANNVIKRIAIPAGIEDGVLYADEVAGLNLSHIDLLVLSACQSGLGDIAASEGVFGLQRGFKLAGVGSIVMSLWKVNDQATTYLMTQMYQNLMNGQGRQEALTNAQWALRTYEGGRYDDSRHWAAFVLLDALD